MHVNNFDPKTLTDDELYAALFDAECRVDDLERNGDAEDTDELADTRACLDELTQERNRRQDES